MLIIFLLSIPLIWIVLFLFNSFVLIRNKDVNTFRGDEDINILDIMFSPVITIIYLLIILLSFDAYFDGFFKFVNEYPICQKETFEDVLTMVSNYHQLI